MESPRGSYKTNTFFVYKKYNGLIFHLYFVLKNISLSHLFKKYEIDNKCVIRSHQTVKSIYINCIECYSLNMTSPRAVCALPIDLGSQLIFSFQIVGTLYDLE